MYIYIYIYTYIYIGRAQPREGRRAPRRHPRGRHGLGELRGPGLSYCYCYYYYCITNYYYYYVSL